MNNQEPQKNYYAILPANVRYDNRLTPNAKLLYAEITALTNERGYCWATNEYFSKLYGVSKVSISKWINQLVEHGYLESVMVYREGTKSIQERRLYIATPIKEKLNGQREVEEPVKEKLKRGNKEKLKENNKGSNTKKNNKKQDKKDKQTSLELPEKHPFTKAIIDRGVIEEHDLDVPKFDALFHDVLWNHDYRLVSTCLNYTIARMKEKEDIGSKYAYLESSLRDNIAKMEGNNIRAMEEKARKEGSSFYNWLEA